MVGAYCWLQREPMAHLHCCCLLVCRWEWGVPTDLPAPIVITEISSSSVVCHTINYKHTPESSSLSVSRECLLRKFTRLNILFFQLLQTAAELGGRRASGDGGSIETPPPRVTIKLQNTHSDIHPLHSLLASRHTELPRHNSDQGIAIIYIKQLPFLIVQSFLLITWAGGLVIALVKLVVVEDLVWLLLGHCQGIMQEEFWLCAILLSSSSRTHCRLLRVCMSVPYSWLTELVFGAVNRFGLGRQAGNALRRILYVCRS